MAGEQLQQFTDQLDTFTKKLEEFAMKHRDEIRKNAQFRRYFQEMCMTVGVDPLACKCQDVKKEIKSRKFIVFRS